MTSLCIYLLFCLFSLAEAGKIGAFRFKNFVDGAFKPYDPIARRYDNTYIGKLTYANGARTSIQSPRTAKLQNILNRLPYSDRTIPNGDYIVHMVVRQQNAAAEDIEESDLNSADHTSKASSLTKHVKKSDCVEDATHEVLEFEISQHTNNHLSMPDLLDSECVSLPYKDRKSWTQNPYSLTEKTTAENCADGEFQDAHLYRDLQATFTAPTSTRTVRVPAHECVDTGEEEVLSVQNEATPEVFTESYVLEEECTNNADAIEAAYAFNAGDRWVKSNRGDAVTLSAEVTVDTTAALPFFKNFTLVSSTSMTTTSGTNDYAVGQEIDRKSSYSVQRNTLEPAFTVTAWVKGHGTIFSMASAAMPEACGRKSTFFIESSGQPKNDWGCSDTHISSLRTNTAQWTHVAFRYNGYGQRSIVIGNQEQTDVSYDTSKDYFAETGSLSSPKTHNAVIVRYNELGDVIGNYEGYSLRQCFKATLAANHIYFEVSNGVCRSSATKGSGSSAIYRRSIQYMITEVDFSGEVKHGPFNGQVDEVLVFNRYLKLQTVEQVAAHMTVQGRFDGTSRINHALTGLGTATKVSWTRYADFTEEQIERADCYDSSDERYTLALNHPTYAYTGEGRGYGVPLDYTPYSGALENVNSFTLSAQDSLSICNREHFDTKLVLHSYQETTHDECTAKQVNDGVCLQGNSMTPSTRAACTGTFFPSRAYTWKPDDPTILYDVSEADCTLGGDAWGQAQPILYGLQGRNIQVFSDHEMTFYWKNKVGGETYPVNRNDLQSMKEWCRGTISCAGLQFDGSLIYPVEKTLSPQDDSSYGYRVCDQRLHKPIQSAMQCFLEAAERFGPEGLVYVYGDEHRTFAWGYQGTADGTACYQNGNTLKWTATASGDRVCSDEPSDYEFLPFEQSRWQRDNDSITSTKEDDCTLHKLDWKAHNRVYETVGTSSRPHFVLQGQKSWQREPVDCLYATSATFPINKNTARECRDEAIFWGATGYSFQRQGAEFLYFTPRHFTHVEEAREECKRLHAHRAGPENTWDLCTNAQYDCAADDSCITSNTPDNTIFAVAACCFNTGTSCAITTNTDTCTPKNGYESFSFKACADEVIQSTTNTTYNVYDPVWTRSEWRDETRSRTYDPAYYDIVQQTTACDRRTHLSFEECLTEKAKAAYSGLTWLGKVYDKEKIAGCAVEGTQIYYNAYRYDSAKQPQSGDKTICRRHFEHFTETFDYSNTNCRYLNHELEVSRTSILACQAYADQTSHTAFSFSGTRCLLAKDRGPCEKEAGWQSRFFVAPEAVEQFQKNANHEYSVLPILDCAQNTTAESRIVQVSWGPEAYGIAWKLPSNPTAYASEAAAQTACTAGCPAIYTDGTNYYALDRLEASDEMAPTDASYAQHKHRIRNVENFQNKKLATHFLSISKEQCHAQCVLETTCRMVQFAYGQCIFYNEIYETLSTDYASFIVYQEIKGAVSYGPTGDCWLYKNYVGQRFSASSSEGDCSQILTTGSGYKTFPVDERLAGENKVVYLLTEPDLTQATQANSIVHKQRSQQWCVDRDGQGSWSAYPNVIHEKEEDDCAGTWTRNANIVRNNILQRECELPDSKSISWTRNADAVTQTQGKGGYALLYENGYALRLGKTCDALDLKTYGVVYGHACLEKTECSEADQGHGYAVIDGECYSYLYEAGGNASDCKWQRTLPQGTSYLPVVHKNLADAVEACNNRATCAGICERKEARGRTFVLAKASKASEPSCHAGWTGNDCTKLSPSYNTDESITDKRHTAIAYCDRIGQRLCPKQTPFPMGNLMIQIAPQSACVHYEASTECPVGDYSTIEAVASCCGRTEKSGKVLVEALYYERVQEPGACSYAKELAGSMVIDRTPKLTNSYTVQQIAKAVCTGGTVSTTGNCEAACFADSTCVYFSNSSTECKLHTICTGFLRHFDASAGAFRLRRKPGRYDTPQALHEIIGDCKYHYTVRSPKVIEQAPYREASDALVPWRCERATVPLDRRLSLLRFSINETFKFDVMEDHHLNNSERIELTYQQLDYSDSTEATLQDCLNKNEGKVNAYDESSKRCRTFHDPSYTIPTQASFLGQSYRSAGLFEEFRIATEDTFTVLTSLTIQPVLQVSDWSLSSAQDECEVHCLENNCEAYLMSGQYCKLIEMPDVTTIEYLRAMEPAGNVLLRLKTPSELVCRPMAAGWKVTNFEAASMPFLPSTELLGHANALRECKQLFLNDPRTPRLDTLLYNSGTKECRISLLRNSLVQAEGPSTDQSFQAYRIASAAENPYRKEATRFETEDISRETCLPTAGLLAGRDCTSIECAAFWFREEDVIRHEITEEQCNPTTPVQLPLLSFAWDRNTQGTLTFNVAEDTCKASEKFISWRTGTEGVGKVVVQSEAECLSKSTDEVVAVYLGNEPLPDHRSACNGIVDEHSFEKMFPHPILMVHPQTTRIVSAQPSIDECAAHANAYYAHQNRSTESKVFEYNFVDSQCAIFSEIECPTLCLPDETSSSKQGFSAFRLHGESGLTAASCWLLSVLDSRRTGRTSCRKCPLGKHSARAGSNCLPCQQGRYADEEGLRACKSCPEGKFQFGSGETHCHNCPAGSYQEIGEGKRSCKLCAAGKYEKDNSCHDCPTGKAAPNNFPENSAGELVYSGANYKGPLLYYDPRYDYSDVHGISYKEADGSYMKGYSPVFTALRKLQMEQHDSPDDCVSCQAGSYNDEEGAFECKACDAGQFNNALEATSCTACSIGEVARPSEATFHELMPFACYSAEELGEYRETGGAYPKTGEDIGLLSEQPQGHLEDCFQSCKDTAECLFVSYKAGSCRLHRKCDERGESGWTAYRLSKPFSSIADSTSNRLSIEATVYGPTHHECEEDSLLLAPKTYYHKENFRITSAGTIGTAQSFQEAIDRCNLRRDCIGFTYSGGVDVSLRIFSEDNPILLKSQGSTVEQTGLQSWFKEEPVKTKEECQNQCAQLADCSFMEWNGTMACRKWGPTCTPKKKASLTAAESSIYRISLASSFRLFPFKGRWPCDAVVFGSKTKEECEAEAVARTAPMFYYEDDHGTCHVYVSYTTNGINDLYSGLLNRHRSVCLSGNAPPSSDGTPQGLAAFFDDTAEGYLYLIGKKAWDKAATQCSFCPAGLHTEVASATQCRQCEAGTYDKNPKSSNPCQACELGRYQDEPGQATCKACSAGRYADEEGSQRCKASGQGYRAIGQGFPSSPDLQAKSSSPLQNNSYASSANIDFEGATGREICGRNSFANGYENLHCKKVPLGAISVKKERVWTKETSACLYDNSTVDRYVPVNASIAFYVGDKFNRMGMHSLDDCIGFANEQSTGATADAVAVSFGEGFCLFFSETTEGLVPNCIPNPDYESAALSISEVEFGTQSDQPAISPEWKETFTPYEDVRFVSPYLCEGINYQYIGDYFSATDCTTMCRMQEAFGYNPCRYVSYSNDNKCWFVNWKESGSSGVYNSDTTTNIEEICSYGSRSVPRVSGDTSIGSGGYPINPAQTLTYTIDATKELFNIPGKNDAEGKPSMGINGYYSTDAKKSEWYIPDCDTVEKRIVDTATLTAECRWARKRHYEFMRYTLLQEHTLPSNIFPDYKLNGGYQSEASNLLKIMGFYDFKIDLHADYDKQFLPNQDQVDDAETCQTFAILNGYTWLGSGSDNSWPIKCVFRKYNENGITGKVFFNTISSSIRCYSSNSATYMNFCVFYKGTYSYKKVQHYHYNHSVIRPLFDVGQNPDNFYRTDTSVGQNRALKGANSYEYCTGSTTQLYLMLAPKSCDDLGFPFVADRTLSTGSSKRICTKMSIGENGLLSKSSNPKCCIGTDCAGYELCSSSQFSESGLLSISYTATSLKVLTNNVVLSFVDDDEEYGMRYIKDQCNQLGDTCLGVSMQQEDEDTILFQGHGQGSTFLNTNEGKEFILKSENYGLEGFFEPKDVGSVIQVPNSNIHGCYIYCIIEPSCRYFFFNLTSSACFVQNYINLQAVPNDEEEVILFQLPTNLADDSSKAQYCSNCPIGSTSSSAAVGSVGVCSACEPGYISRTSELYVSLEQVGEAGQEQCQQCPAGMLFLANTHSCIACPLGFACPQKGSIIGQSATQCGINEYSTSSLLDFVSEDISSTASLRCSVCSGGKYTNEPGAGSCEKCPKGYYSLSRGKCQPCPLGTYTLTTGSEECFAVDSQSFIVWPASTLSDRRTCSTESCDPGNFRVCNGESDAECQPCPNIQAGYRTWFVAVGATNTDEYGCKSEKCPFGTFSASGCLGENCCQTCVSTCKAGQHSVGCGGPDDNGGSTQNTQCADCPVDTFTEFDAEEKQCHGNFNNDKAPFYYNVLDSDNPESRALDENYVCSYNNFMDNSPHVNGDLDFDLRSSFSTFDSQSRMTIVESIDSLPLQSYGVYNDKDPVFPRDDSKYNMTHSAADYEQLAWSREKSFTIESKESFANFPSCCSAAAYKCIPCRSKTILYRQDLHLTPPRSEEFVSYYAEVYVADLGAEFGGGSETFYFGKKNAPLWSTNGETGQSKCTSWWAAWGEQTYKNIKATSETFPNPPAPAPAPASPSPSSSSPSPSCFPSDAIVETPEGKKSIYEIDIGDFVLSHEGFSEVYLLSHADNETLGDYIRLSTDNGTSLRLSAEHFILSNGRYVYAKDVRKGDSLAYGETVIDIEFEKARGLWNPFTMAGTIVVDGIVASCHSDWFLEELPEWMRPSAAIIPSIYQTLVAPARKIYQKNSAWVKRFTKSFEGKNIGEHSLTDIWSRMWTTYWEPLR